MDQITYDVVFAVIRESVSLFVLLVFLFFSYKILKQIIEGGLDKSDELIQVIKDIRDRMSK
jgi:hypothetical protein